MVVEVCADNINMQTIQKNSNLTNRKATRQQYINIV